MVIKVTDQMLHAVYEYMEGEYEDDELVKRIIELHEANKPKPEPVAWMSPNKERLEFSRIDTVYGSHTIPLYTTPPTREPLSEEEIEKLVPWQGDPKDPFFSRIDFARAIEQAHGIGTQHEFT